MPSARYSIGFVRRVGMCRKVYKRYIIDKYVVYGNQRNKLMKRVHPTPPIVKDGDVITSRRWLPYVRLHFVQTFFILEQFCDFSGFFSDESWTKLGSNLFLWKRRWVDEIEHQKYEDIFTRIGSWNLKGEKDKTSKKNQILLMASHNVRFRF